MVFRVYIRYDSSSETVDVLDKTRTDEYTISIDQNGKMQTKKKSLKTIDHSESPHANWIANMFTNLNDMMNDIKTSITAFVVTDMKSIDAP